MEIPHSASLLDGLELCTSHVRSISTKPLTRAAELCDAVPKGACLAKSRFEKSTIFVKFQQKIANVVKFAKFYQTSPFRNRVAKLRGPSEGLGGNAANV